jgi:GNAT superfamily N-acetyltransferase
VKHVIIAWYPTAGSAISPHQTEATVRPLSVDRLYVLRDTYVGTWGAGDHIPGVDWLREPITDDRAQPFVAMVDDRPVGCVVPVIQRDRTEGVLSKGVHVLPDFQRRGIGSSLLIHALQWYRDMDIAKAWVWPWNPKGEEETEQAELFYLANGGTIVERHAE